MHHALAHVAIASTDAGHPRAVERDDTVDDHGLVAFVLPVQAASALGKVAVGGVAVVVAGRADAAIAARLDPVLAARGDLEAQAQTAQALERRRHLAAYRLVPCRRRGGVVDLVSIADDVACRHQLILATDTAARVHETLAELVVVDRLQALVQLVELRVAYVVPLGLQVFVGLDRVLARELDHAPGLGVGHQLGLLRVTLRFRETAEPGNVVDFGRGLLHVLVEQLVTARVEDRFVEQRLGRGAELAHDEVLELDALVLDRRVFGGVVQVVGGFLKRPTLAVGHTDADVRPRLGQSLVRFGAALAQGVVALLVEVTALRIIQHLAPDLAVFVLSLACAGRVFDCHLGGHHVGHVSDSPAEADHRPADTGAECLGTGVGLDALLVAAAELNAVYILWDFYH